MNIINLTARNSGERIDRFLSKDLENLSRSYLQKLLKDGDIIEQGTHESLLAAGGFYANLYNSQFEKVS